MLFLILGKIVIKTVLNNVYTTRDIHKAFPQIIISPNPDITL